MDVKFISVHKGNTVIPAPKIGPRHVIRFSKGRYSTAHKGEIKKLLSDEYCNRKVKLAPNQDLKAINEYLMSSDRPDTLTRDYLDDIPFEAWKEIIEVRDDINVQFPMVGIAKTALEGKSLSTEIEQIVAKYKDAGTTDADQEVQDRKVQKRVDELTTTKEHDLTGDPDVGETVEIVVETSKDGNAKEIVELIEQSPEEDLEGFLDAEEDRVTVLRAWNERFPDQAVELPETD